MDPFDQLFEDFGGVSKDVWKEKVVADLKGKAFEDLIFTDEDGLLHQPYYDSSDLSDKVSLINNSEPWTIMHFYDAENWKVDELLDELNYAFDNGLQKAIIKLKSLTKDWLEATKDLDVHFYCESGIDHDRAIIDPLRNAILKEGNVDVAADMKGTLLVDASIYAERGASAAEEIAHTLYHLTEYIDLLTERGMSPQKAIERILIKTSIGNSYFSQVSKIRALRVNVRRLYAHYEVDHEPMIWADSNSYYLDAESFNNNLIRLSCQAMSAVLGNCNWLSLSMQAAETDKKRFAARMCRNVQLIMKHESKMDEVDDLVRGAYYVENLTNELMDLAWKKYAELESKGSLMDQLSKDSFWNEIDKTASKRVEQYQKGERAMIAVNKYQYQENGSTDRLRSTIETLSDQLKNEA